MRFGHPTTLDTSFFIYQTSYIAIYSEYNTRVYEIAVIRALALRAGIMGVLQFDIFSTFQCVACCVVTTPIIKAFCKKCNLMENQQDSKQEEEVPDSVGADTNAHDSRRMTAESGLHTAKAQRVPERDEEEAMVIEESQSDGMKWYQRPLYRWICVGFALLVCIPLVTVIVFVVRPWGVSSSSLPPPTPEPTTGAPTGAPVFSGTGAPVVTEPTTAPPTSLTPEWIACKFLSMPDLATCRIAVALAGRIATDSTIPTEIGLLTQMEFLGLEGNELTSSIPSEIGLLTRLEALYLRDNQLTSTIPSEIARLTLLDVLSLGQNQFTSTIPSEIALLTELTVLNFEVNQFVGEIPSEIGLLTQLSSLFLGETQLTGTIPFSLCSPFPVFMFIDCGEITCDCCVC